MTPTTNMHATQPAGAPVHDRPSADLESGLAVAYLNQFNEMVNLIIKNINSNDYKVS
jgi:hypothetical protein